MLRLVLENIHTQGYGLRKITSQKAPNHEILGGQHLDFYGKSTGKFIQLPKGKS